MFICYLYSCLCSICVCVFAVFVPSGICDLCRSTQWCGVAPLVQLIGAHSGHYKVYNNYLVWNFFFIRSFLFSFNRSLSRSFLCLICLPKNFKNNQQKLSIVSYSIASMSIDTLKESFVIANRGRNRFLNYHWRSVISADIW